MTLSVEDGDRAMMVREQDANYTTAAPKKKQEKMNLGEFLTNQCTSKSLYCWSGHATTVQCQSSVSM